MDFKVHPSCAVPIDVTDIDGMQRRGPGPSIDFGFDTIDTEVFEMDVLTPADLRSALRWRRSLA